MKTRRCFVVIDARDKVSAPVGKRVVARLQDLDVGHEVEWVQPRDNAGFVVDSRLRGNMVLVAVGGEGLLHEVASVAVARGLNVGWVPVGASDIAAGLGVPARMEDAVDLIVSGEASQHDMAEVNGKLFFGHAAFGNRLDRMVAQVRADYHNPGVLGRAWMLATLVWRVGVHRVTMVYGGKHGEERSKWILQVRVRLQAQPDGASALAAHVLRVDRWRQLLALLRVLWRGDVALWPAFKHRTTDVLQVYGDKPLPVYAGGVVLTHTPAVFKVREGALWMFTGPV